MQQGRGGLDFDALGGAADLEFDVDANAGGGFEDQAGLAVRAKAGHIDGNVVAAGFEERDDIDPGLVGTSGLGFAGCDIGHTDLGGKNDGVGGIGDGSGDGGEVGLCV